MKNQAVLYLRSSKDRSDVSIDAQRRELAKLAEERSLTIVHEYADVVESAKDEDRPSFQRLFRDMRHHDRVWTHILMVDTSRLSRRQYFAAVFKHECEKLGIEIHYSKLPDTDPIVKVVLEAVFEAMDVVHSMMSKEKGIAGMKENVQQGYRAGGRAPRGYQLKKTATGAMREGKPVTKSSLEPSDEAPQIKAYLKGRAEGRTRNAMLAETRLKIPKNSLVGMERNALTYAGHTVWNMHNEFVKGQGYKGGVKHRPRDEWVINRNTHEALITDAEAEIIIRALDVRANGPRPNQTTAHYLLTGVLVNEEGRAWQGNAGYYRLNRSAGKGSKSIKADRLESAIMERIGKDFASPVFAKAVKKEVAIMLDQLEDDPAEPLRTKSYELSKKVTKYMELSSQLEDPAPALREVEKLERERKVLQERIESLDVDYQNRSHLKSLTLESVQTMLKGVANRLNELDRGTLRHTLLSVIEKIELSTDATQCNVLYRVGISGSAMASPRGCHGATTVNARARVDLTRRKTSSPARPRRTDLRRC